MNVKLRLEIFLYEPTTAALVLLVLGMGPSPLHILDKYSTGQLPSHPTVALNATHIKQKYLCP